MNVDYTSDISFVLGVIKVDDNMPDPVDWTLHEMELLVGKSCLAALFISVHFFYYKTTLGWLDSHIGICLSYLLLESVMVRKQCYYYMKRIKDCGLDSVVRLVAQS